MKITDFMRKHGAAAAQISGPESLAALQAVMDRGLAGQGNIPMLPSYLSGEIQVPEGAVCAVMDAGGTNYRSALARYESGEWKLSGLQVRPMPGTEGELGFAGFYEALAAPVRELGDYDRIGFCFSYNVTMDRALDGKLDFWCKEVRAPECVGKPVGASLKNALGSGCRRVHVLNDSVAAMLGAGDVQVGVILGTGINVCYSEKCGRIFKITEKLNSDTMIISTEIGEFDGIPVSDFEQAVIEGSDAPDSARAEKQCSGGYLGSVIGRAWATAAAEGILPDSFRDGGCDLASVSQMLAGTAENTLPEEAAGIAKLAISRAAKIGAILCAAPILRTEMKKPKVAVEGSQYWKLTGFREAFHRELDELLKPYGVAYEIVRSENACLTGAARAAFAEPM